MQAFKA